MRVCLMIEGQEDVTWSDWVGLARACEDGGLEGLFSSDHYVSVFGRAERGSFDVWAVLAGLAAVTGRIRLGSMVSPVTFRHPSVLAKAASTVDHISGGRVELGMGAGWSEREHRAYGFPFPPLGVRMELLEEQLEIVHRSWTEAVFDFEGRHYRLEECRALHKPTQRPHPPLIVAGSARPRSVAAAARWGDEYNTIFASPAECRDIRARLEEAWEREGRDPATLRLSLMTGCVVGTDRAEVRERARRRLEVSDGGGDPEAALRENADTWVAGTPEEVVERLRAYEDAGVDRVLLQHLDHRDLELVELLGREVAPAVAAPVG